MPPREGWSVWSEADGCVATFAGGAWRVGTLAATEVKIAGLKVLGARRPAVAAATGGSTIDVEARAALGQVLAALAAHGLIAP